MNEDWELIAKVGRMENSILRAKLADAIAALEKISIMVDLLCADSVAKEALAKLKEPF